MEPNKKKGKVAGIIVCILIFLLIGAGTGYLIYSSQKNINDYKDIVDRAAHRNSDFKVEFKHESNDTETEELVETDGTSGRTVMVYMLGSNLETYSGFASNDIDEMMAAELSDDVNVIIQTGGSERWRNSQIDDGVVERFKVENGQLTKLESLGKVSMVEDDTLLDFITYSVENYPAGGYTLVLWDHGGGIPLSFGSDEMFDGELDCVEIGNVLRDSGVHFEAVVFDACLMCSLELMISIQDSADYIVAAETSEPALGHNYTGWLTAISADPDILTSDYCEIIADDTISDLHAHNQIGSISVIRLSKIDRVYDAYIDYMDMVYANVVEGDGYAEYYKARGECGSLERIEKYEEDMTDAVDLSTLAMHYAPDKDTATALINAVSSAVVYTQSDLSYGHGITTYSPYEYAFYEDYYYYYDLYELGRVSWEQLGYDQVVEAFYDYFASRILDNMNVDYVPDWYVPDRNYNNSGEMTTASGSSDNDYILGLTKVNDGYVCELTEEDWSIINNVYANVDLLIDSDGDEVRIHIGQYRYYQKDSDGNLLITPPAKLLLMNDEIVMYDVLDYYQDELSGAWEEIGIAYATVNDKDSIIIIYWSDEYPEGQIIGYRDYDWENDTYGDVTYDFEETDVIEAQFVYSIEGEVEDVICLFDPVEYKDVYLEYLDTNSDIGSWSGFDTYVTYTITTVYGNEYMTEEARVSN